MRLVVKARNQSNLWFITFTIFTLAGFFFITTFAHAKIYKWRDENGTLHFSDKPVNKPNMKVYSIEGGSIGSFSAPETNAKMSAQTKALVKSAPKQRSLTKREKEELKIKQLKDLEKSIKQQNGGYFMTPDERKKAIRDNKKMRRIYNNKMNRDGYAPYPKYKTIM